MILFKFINIKTVIRPSKIIHRCFSNVKDNLNKKLTLTSPTFLKYISNLRTEYESLSNRSKLNKNLTSRLKYLKPIVRIFEEYQLVSANIKSLDELSNDENMELKAAVEEEHKLYISQLHQLDNTLRETLLRNDEDPHEGIFFEITAGVGGQEAMLFARDLYEMYLNYIVYKGWSYTLADLDNSDIGGVRHASILIEGDDVYSCLSVEAGVHRVQRVPTTEKSGRVHTSTVTVAALPQPDEVDINIKPSDLRIETKRASGAGGQHVNTTDSAVRIVHIPTNIVVECQTERSQLKNKEIALQRLRIQLYQKQLDEQTHETQTTRKSQVGSSLRNEKIRTYNFNQHRVSDHRIQETIYNLTGFLDGNEVLDELINKLRYHRQINLLIANLEKL